ncbi:MAG: YceI family protein [Calothrix sp. SM1_5_4]|nr:YceI family protein [Calothrix sp. SM1_5_4]
MRFLAVIWFVTLVSSAVSHAATYRFNPDKGDVSFLAKGKPALISIKGSGEGLSGQLTERAGKLSGVIQFELKKLKTGIELRDQHLKDKYLEVAKHPQAELKIDEINAPKPGEKFAFEGTLSLHGASQTVRGEAKFTANGNVSTVSAEFPIKLSQFGIPVPSFQGITVAEDVTVKVDAPVGVGD